MVNFLKNLLIPAVLLIGLPLAGAFCKGADLSFYLSFPPETQFASHAPFSVPIFCAIALFACITVSPFVWRAFQFLQRNKTTPEPERRPFPWWGYIALLFFILFWVLAWTRFAWFAPLQAHTFFPLWLCFIVLVNALVYQRKGSAPLTDAPARFAGLFPASAAFWWFFEYLNRFIQNWYYTGSEYPPLQYFLLATLSFSTVLPAVRSIRALLMTFPVFQEGFSGFPPLPAVTAKPAALSVLILSALGLFLLPFFPDPLFFLVWISPLLVIVSLQVLKDRPNILAGVKKGDYTRIVSYASAALICGFFWEMWNFFSLSKWIYSVPYVHAFQIFEMPVLGYTGYLPFGIECAVIIQILTAAKSKDFPHET